MIKRKTVKYKLTALVVAFLAFYLFVAATPRDTITNKTFTFKTLKDTSLQLTVFYPDGDKKIKRPVMIFFHGGAWIKGSRKVMFPFCEYFAARGIVTVSASYRLIKGKQDIPGIETCIEDAKSAVRWVKEHAAELQIDTSRVILSGGSAGGHLATMCAFDDRINDPLDNKKTSTKVGTLVLLNPAYPPDFDASIEPFGLVTQSATSAFFVYGTNDPLRKPGKLFYDELISKNNKAEIWYALGEKHAFFNKEDWRIATMLKMDEFLTSRHLLQPLAKPIHTSDLKFISSDTP